MNATLMNQIVFFLWMPVFLLWAITSGASKRTVQSRSDSESRVALWVVWIAWLLLFGHGFRRPVLSAHFTEVTPATDSIGLALTVIGLGFSVWARFAIGSNWSARIELKQGHQLIRRGPYAILRHPIYSGFMLATLGTAIAFAEWSGLLAFALIVLAWGYKARLEENVMLEQFGSEYEEYRRKVKGLIPFVW
jgi:protein-S-isoprenylcysteine O-methyltransferase Ste14